MSVSLRLRELLVAKEWGIPVHEWDVIPKAARAEMMAVSQVDNLIQSFQRENMKGNNDA